MVEAQLLHELHSKLSALSSSLASRGCQPVPLLAYGHYPLSTTAAASAAGSRSPSSPEEELLRSPHSSGPARIQSAWSFGAGSTSEGSGSCREAASEAAAAAAEAAAATGKDSTALPLGTCPSSPVASAPRLGGIGSGESVGGGRPSSLSGLLLLHNVSLFLNGHLHNAFGTRLHRMHRGSGGEQVRTETRLEAP